MCEEIDLSDNYLEGEGAAALATMLKNNMFVVNLVSLKQRATVSPTGIHVLCNSI